MMYNAFRYWVLGLCPLSYILKNATYWKPCFSPTHLRTETDPVSETSCSLEYRTMDKFRKSSNPKTLLALGDNFSYDFILKI
jgi:hypothetical protein